MDYKKIGEYIQSKRKAIPLTQAELGEKLGVTSKAVSKWECGVALPDVSLFVDLCKILKIEISELLNGEDKKNKIDNVRQKEKYLIRWLSFFCVLLSIMTLFLGTYFVKNYGKIEVYELKSTNKEISIKGELFSVKGENYISIKNVSHNLKKNTDVDSLGYDVEYELYYQENLIARSGDIDSVNITENTSALRLNRLLEGITIFCPIKQKIDMIKATKDFLILRVRYLNDKRKFKELDIPISLK